MCILARIIGWLAETFDYWLDDLGFFVEDPLLSDEDVPG